jgi:hypothetical protein
LSSSFVEIAAIWRPGEGPSDAPLASFGEVLQLSQANVEEEGDRLAVALAWQVIGAPETPLATFVHVYDAAGGLVAQSDAPPGGGFAPQNLWRPGDSISDTRGIDLSSLPPGSYSVAVGVYNPVDGSRLTANAGGQALPDSLLTIGRIGR